MDIRQLKQNANQMSGQAGYMRNTQIRWVSLAGLLIGFAWVAVVVAGCSQFNQLLRQQPLVTTHTGSAEAEGGGSQVDTADTVNKVGSGVIELLEAEGQAFVVIALVQPGAMQTSPIDLVALRTEINNLQAEVLAALEPSEFQIAQQFETVPAMSGIITRSGLEKLMRHASVVRIDLDVGGSGG